mmetsp:Transcript_25644/g.47842  ORF Transcript_25644/g.47842 Transcript_25644/m.47842 type:complete len:260 (+) Transcript_25644:721-1500(+)
MHSSTKLAIMFFFGDFFMKGCSSNSVAVGRAAGSFTKHFATKSLNSGDQSPSPRVGGGLFGIRKIALIGWTLLCGGSPTAHSIAVIPRDQISALASYPVFFSVKTSGAIQYGVPMTVLLLAKVFASSFDTPKSASLQSPAWFKRMFAALISRWIFFFLWRYCSPKRECFITTAICFSSSVVSQIAIKSQMAPAPQYSMAIHILPSFSKLPLYLTMYGELHSLRMLISFWRSAASSFSTVSTLIATVCPSRVSTALNTAP